ncbi:24578_t:CDS:10 [Cetraspora pellucida]|uniref:24578_t:CDS:1 n=1 Tax=Cetraspora pellucida TaxID=1433469 RepID=A0A9N8ZH46_9GLOM|nr:24578_t:CDS:10 [Cetraspora pellucida]
MSRIIKNLGINILKGHPNSLANSITILELENCHKCNEEILLNPSKTFITLMYSHILHYNCFKKSNKDKQKTCPICFVDNEGMTLAEVQDINISEAVKDEEPDKVQGLIKELSMLSEPINDNDKGNKSKKSKPITLLQLYYNANWAKNHYLFAKKFEERVKEIKNDNSRYNDQQARGLVYDEVATKLLGFTRDTFWESTDQPSLKKFLDFQLSAGDIEDSRVEYNRYKKELDKISKFYAEASKSGQEGKDCLSVDELAPLTALRLIISLSTPTTLQSCVLVVGMTACLLDKLSNEVQNQLVEDKINFRKEKANAKVQKLQTNQYITVATVVTEQIQQYAKSTTTSIMKRFFDNDNKRTAKCIRTNKDSEDDDGTENSPFLESVENLSSVSLKNQFFLDNDPFPMSGKKLFNNDKDIIDEFFSGPSTQVSHDLVMTEYPQQTLPCILKSGDNFTDVWNNEFTSKRSMISHPSTTEAMWSIIMSFITGKVIQSGYVEYTWGEVKLDLTALRKDSGCDIFSLPRVATGHKGDELGLSNDGRKCFVMEISYALQDQDRWKTAEDLYKLLREMRDMLHISKKEKCELGYKIPKEARKIGSIKISNNDITKLVFVLQMMWAFKERVASANEVWNNLESRYENYTMLESSDDGNNFTKITPKKQSKRTDQ